MKSLLIAAVLPWIFVVMINAQDVTSSITDQPETTEAPMTTAPPEISTTTTEEPTTTTEAPTTTTEEPTTTTEQSTMPPDDQYCHNGGTVSCSCPPGFTGKRCESFVNWCNATTVYEDGEETSVSPCGPHGTCHFHESNGSYCVCDHGWTGKFCDTPIPDEVIISTRCHFNYGAANPNPDCKEGWRCLPDKLNCGFVPCSSPDNIGWCLPIPMHQRIMDAFMARRFDRVRK